MLSSLLVQTKYYNNPYEKLYINIISSVTNRGVKMPIFSIASFTATDVVIHRLLT
jgi:hypothetical protein